MSVNEMDIFGFMYEQYHLPNKLKLFEAFSGIGCQRMAFDRLTIDYEMVGISEVDKDSILSYGAIHTDMHDITQKLTKEEMVTILQKKKVGYDFKKKKNTINMHKKREIIEKYFIADQLSHNYGDISSIDGKDLPQTDIFTYSFPCTDLSKAGKQKGLNDTRSGLVYEVLRILQQLNDLDRLPKVLIMENVVDLVQTKFIRQFQAIQLELEKLGYSNYTEILNAKNYGVAQNRDRVFMVSILGEYSYEFPKPIKLEKRLKDYLEDNVDEKYYLSDKALNGVLSTQFNCSSLEARIEKDGIMPTLCARDYKDPKLVIEPTICASRGRENGQELEIKNDGISNALTTVQKDNYLLVPEATKKGYAEAHEGDGIYINRPHQKRGCVQKGMIQTIKASGQDVGVVVEPKRIGGLYDNENGRHQAGSIWDKDAISPTIDTMQGGHRQPFIVEDKKDMLKTTLCNQLIVNDLENILYNILDLCYNIDEKEIDKYGKSKSLLQILWQEIGKKEIWKEIRGFFCFQEKEILQQDLYEKRLFKSGDKQPNIFKCTHNSEKNKQPNFEKDSLRNLWIKIKYRYTPQRWELSEQQFRKLDMLMQELPQQKTQDTEILQNMWQKDEGVRLLRQTLSALQEIWKPIIYKEQNKGLRIRKLCPIECWRLMGIDDECFNKAEKVCSNSQLYKQAGNGIVVDVFMEIVRNLI